MNYLEHFGLQTEPFLNSPSSRVFYKSAVHGKALLQLMTAADAEGGVLLIVGESGVGKSLLLRRVLESISEESTRAAFLSIPQGGVEERHLVRALAHQLRMPPSKDSLAGLDEGISELAGEGIRVLILVDEAHRLPLSILGTLTQLGSASIVLAGAAAGDYPPGERFVVTPLNADATDAYIRLRLKVAGRVQEIFSLEARKLVHTISRGFPSRINALCEHALLGGALAGLERINEASVLTTGLLLGLCDENAKPLEPVVSTGVPASVVPAQATQSSAKPASTQKKSQPVEDLDDVLSQLAEDDSDAVSPPVETPVVASKPSETDEFDSMLGSLDDDDEIGQGTRNVASQISQEEADSEPSQEQDDDFDSMLNDMVEEEKQPAPVIPKKNQAKKTAPIEDDDGLDDLLGGLGSDEEDVPATPSKALSGASMPDTSDSELDDLLGDLSAGEEEEQVPASKSAGLNDDLDSLLNGLGDEEETPAPIKAAKPSPKTTAPKPASKPEPIASEEEDFDNMLSGLDEEINGAKSATADTTGDDLDDLLAGLEDEEKPVVKAPVKAAAKSKPASKPVPVPAADDDLNDLLDSLDDEGPAVAAKPVVKETKKPSLDNLESELDNLLDGLDD